MRQQKNAEERSCKRELVPPPNQLGRFRFDARMLRSRNSRYLAQGIMKIHISLFPAKPPRQGGSGNIPFDGEGAMSQLVCDTHEKGVAQTGVAHFVQNFL